MRWRRGRWKPVKLCCCPSVVSPPPGAVGQLHKCVTLERVDRYSHAACGLSQLSSVRVSGPLGRELRDLP